MTNDNKKLNPNYKMLIGLGIIIGMCLVAGFLAGGIMSCTGEYSNGKCINPQVVKMCEYEGKKYFFEDDDKINLTALDVIK